jgi:hypothetical protein
MEVWATEESGVANASVATERVEITISRFNERNTALLFRLNLLQRTASALILTHFLNINY